MQLELQILRHTDHMHKDRTLYIALSNSMAYFSVQAPLPTSDLHLLLLQRDIWVCHVSAEGVWCGCVHGHHAVQNRLGRVHEGLGGLGCR